MPALDLLRSALDTVKEHWRIYVAMNIVYYGLVVAGMVYTLIDPGLQRMLIDLVGSAFSEGPLALVGQAYTGGELLTAIVLTFVVNLGIGSFVSITLPSLVIPFSGLLIGVYRAIVWGILFSPVDPGITSVLLPHLVTLVIEGQAYILAMFAAFLQGRGFIWPYTVDATTHREGFIAGLAITLRLYLLIAIVLAVAAIYEGIEIILILPALR